MRQDRVTQLSATAVDVKPTNYGKGPKDPKVYVQQRNHKKKLAPHGPVLVSPDLRKYSWWKMNSSDGRDKKRTWFMHGHPITPWLLSGEQGAQSNHFDHS